MGRFLRISSPVVFAGSGHRLAAYLTHSDLYGMRAIEDHFGVYYVTVSRLVSKAES